MDVFLGLFNNYVLRVSLVSWFVAQFLKYLLYAVIHKTVAIERLFGAGGMPSSHSALVCSASVAIYKLYGPDSGVFALSLIIAVIVMYDAMGVRRAAGEQAKVINKVIISPMKSNKINSKTPNDDNFENIAIKTLKEFLGHTPLEVLGGVIVGISIGLLM